MSFLVIGSDGERIRCGTATQAAGAAERLLRQGCLWIRIADLTAFERLRTGLDEHGDALPRA